MKTFIDSSHTRAAEGTLYKILADTILGAGVPFDIFLESQLLKMYKTWFNNKLYLSTCICFSIFFVR